MSGRSPDAAKRHENQHTKAAALAEAARAMPDEELRRRIAAIRGNPKRPPYRRLNMAETLALAALMEEEALRHV